MKELVCCVVLCCSTFDVSVYDSHAVQRCQSVECHSHYSAHLPFTEGVAATMHYVGQRTAGT